EDTRRRKDSPTVVGPSGLGTKSLGDLGALAPTARASDTAIMLKRALARESPWRSCQFRERLLFLIWLGYIPGVSAIGIPLAKRYGSETPFIIVAALWMAAGAVAGISLSLFKCPRCRKPFFLGKWLSSNPMARKCMRCGLPKWAEAEVGDEAF